MRLTKTNASVNQEEGSVNLVAGALDSPLRPEQ